MRTHTLSRALLLRDTAPCAHTSLPRVSFIRLVGRVSCASPPPPSPLPMGNFDYACATPLRVLNAACSPADSSGCRNVNEEWMDSALHGLRGKKRVSAQTRKARRLAQLRPASGGKRDSEERSCRLSVPSPLPALPAALVANCIVPPASPAAGAASPMPTNATAADTATTTTTTTTAADTTPTSAVHHATAAESADAESDAQGSDFFAWLHGRHVHSLLKAECVERQEVAAIEGDLRSVWLGAVGACVALGGRESVGRWALCREEAVAASVVGRRGLRARRCVFLMLQTNGGSLRAAFGRLRSFASARTSQRNAAYNEQLLVLFTMKHVRRRCFRALLDHRAWRQERAAQREAACDEEAEARVRLEVEQHAACALLHYNIRDVRTLLWMSSVRLAHLAAEHACVHAHVVACEDLAWTETAARETVLATELTENKVVAFHSDVLRRDARRLEVLASLSRSAALKYSYRQLETWYRQRLHPSSAHGRAKALRLKSTQRLLRRCWGHLTVLATAAALRRKAQHDACELLCDSEGRLLRMFYRRLKKATVGRQAVAEMVGASERRLAWLYFRRLRRYRRKTREDILEEKAYEMRARLYGEVHVLYYRKLSAWVGRRVQRRLKAAVLLRRNYPSLLHAAYHAWAAHRAETQSVRTATTLLEARAGARVLRRRYNVWVRFRAQQTTATARRMRVCGEVARASKAANTVLLRKCYGLLEGWRARSRRLCAREQNAEMLETLTAERATRGAFRKLTRYASRCEQRRACDLLGEAVTLALMSRRFTLWVSTTRRLRGRPEVQQMALAVAGESRRALLSMRFDVLVRWVSSPRLLARHRSAQRNRRVLLARYYARLVAAPRVIALRQLQREQAEFMAGSALRLLVSRYYYALRRHAERGR